MSLSLLPRHALVKTNELDQGDWNYRRGPLGSISRRRFSMATSLLDAEPVARLLEVGYASGIFLPELARHARAVDGVDLHAEGAKVTKVLAARGVPARLLAGSVTNLPYRDGTFDIVASVSTLEFVDDLDEACLELGRVLRPGGALVVVTPGSGKMLDAGLTVLSGERPEDTFQGRRQRIIPTLRRHFRLERGAVFPPLAPPTLRLYTALRLGKRSP